MGNRCAEFAEKYRVTERVDQGRNKRGGSVLERLTDGTKVVITKEEFVQRARNIAEKIAENNNPDETVVICVLSGALPFYNAIMDELHRLRFNCYQDAIRTVKDATKTSEENKVAQITVSGNMTEDDLKGKKIICVDDQVVSGSTLSRLKEYYSKMKPLDIEFAVGFAVRNEYENELGKDGIKYIGFTVPKKVAGLGMDIKELGRNVPAAIEMPKKALRLRKSGNKTYKKRKQGNKGEKSTKGAER